MIAEQANNPEFSDIVFLVEDKPFYAHKVIICQLSEKFKTMMRSGLQESLEGKTKVSIDGVSYKVFAEIMAYLYTGRFEALDSITVVESQSAQQAQENLDLAIEYLRVSDEEFLDDVKMLCEKKLIEMC